MRNIIPFWKLKGNNLIHGFGVSHSACVVTGVLILNVNKVFHYNIGCTHKLPFKLSKLSVHPKCLLTWLKDVKRLEDTLKNNAYLFQFLIYLLKNRRYLPKIWEGHSHCLVTYALRKKQCHKKWVLSIPIPFYSCSWKLRVISLSPKGYGFV